jgi:hypothetical protein
MRGRLLVVLAGAATATALVAGSAGATTTPLVDRVGPFTTVVPVAFNEPTAENPDGVELMFAECDFVQRVERPDGSATETQQCQLTEPFFAFPGSPPEKALTNTSGECTWFSDYLLTTAPEAEPVTAERARLTVTPSGNVNVTTHYPPAPKTESECEDGPGSL